MEKGIDAQIREYFQTGEVDIRTYSPLTLAYIGDGIYDLVIRSLVVAGGNARANDLHHRTSHIVKAKTQAEMIEGLLPVLNETEQDIEALMGYLYLTDQFERMLFLIRTGLNQQNLVP